MQKKLKNILDVEKSVYICTERLRELIATQSKLFTFVFKYMEKKEKIMSVEDSFVSSDCSVFEITIKKWYDDEFERLASRGKDTSKFHLLADPDINVGSVCCEDYSIRFNRDERIIDLVVNGEKDSPIWNDVMGNVPPVFASCLGDPVGFLYRISTNTSEEKKFYGFEFTDDESCSLFPITEFSASGDWRVENFDELIANI